MSVEEYMQRLVYFIKTKGRSFSRDRRAWVEANRT